MGHSVIMVKEALRPHAEYLSAASMIILGCWAFLQPLSFSYFINYAPYNRHLVQQIRGPLGP
jgi:hypothetical protein